MFFTQDLGGSDSVLASLPAQSVIHTQAGELLLVEQKSKISPPAPPPAMVAARATLPRMILGLRLPLLVRSRQLILLRP